MFNDKYGLTQAVLEGRKTMTRRIVPLYSTIAITLDYDGDDDSEKDKIIRDYIIKNIKPRYQIGEVLAIAQSYGCILDKLEDPENYSCREQWECDEGKRCEYAALSEHPGFSNKMFVSADLMPSKIRFTNIKIERLQDIGVEDAIKEGICINCDAPVSEFAALIDKVSGKGTWESNPFVWVYEFKLIN